MKNGIIIPCYNEEKRIPLDRFAAFLESNDDTLLCFVNDGSKDGTLALLESFHDKHEERVLVYDMPQNGGKAEAVRHGTLHVLQNTDVETVGYLDADLATDFEDYGRLVHALDNGDTLDCVIGSRKCGEQNDIDRSLFRKFASKMVAILIHMIIGLPIKDTQCGAKVFSRSVARRIFADAFHSRWLFDVELFIRMKRYYGAAVLDHIREMALLRWVEVEGSKITLKDTLNMPVRLMDIAYSYHIEPKLEMLMGIVFIPFRQLARPA